jgi:hypothetical protein
LRFYRKEGSSLKFFKIYLGIKAQKWSCYEGRYTIKTRHIVSIDEGAAKNQLSALVRNSVEETLNTLLDEEAQSLCNAEKYSRDEERQNSRAGYYRRQLVTKAGEVTLKCLNSDKLNLKLRLYSVINDVSHLLKKHSWRCS